MPARPPRMWGGRGRVTAKWVWGTAWTVEAAAGGDWDLRSECFATTLRQGNNATSATGARATALPNKEADYGLGHVT